ncbi:MAG: hypothetical protein IKY07_01965, partial [Clostridia bacterium]|nr:hypothetical protein [Clostridia bacterium]
VPYMDRELYGSRRGRSGSYGATDRGSYADSNTNTNTNPHSYAYAYTHPDSYSDTHPDTGALGQAFERHAGSR